MCRSIFAVILVMVVAAGVVMLLPAAMPAFAQETSPCAEDFKKHCSDVTPGSGRLVRCYEERKDRMSGACQAWAEAAKANASVLREACADMLDARCNSEKGDPFATIDCLQSNYVDLSNDCRMKLIKFKDRYPKPVQ